MTNVDISDTVIQQMINQYKKTHPDMKFVAMDLLQMSFEDGLFTCFLDKGTLDALMSDANLDSKERAHKLFGVLAASLCDIRKSHMLTYPIMKEIDRVLKVGGRYICITLLQGHILECITSYFHNLGNVLCFPKYSFTHPLINTTGWMIRICRCEEAEREEDLIDSKKKASSSGNRFSFPVFAVVCTKFKKMERITPLLEFSPCENNVERISSVEDLNERVRSVQHFATLCHRISHDDKAAQDVFIELMDPKSSKKTPKYTLYVVDRQCKSNNKFAAFVVPQGR